LIAVATRASPPDLPPLDRHDLVDVVQVDDRHGDRPDAGAIGGAAQPCASAPATPTTQAIANARSGLMLPTMPCLG
jgi:hypothetical protein